MCLLRRAGHRVEAEKVTGEFLPAHITHYTLLMDAKVSFSGAASCLLKGPPTPYPGKELTRLCLAWKLPTMN